MKMVFRPLFEKGYNHNIPPHYSTCGRLFRLKFIPNTGVIKSFNCGLFIACYLRLFFSPHQDMAGRCETHGVLGHAMGDAGHHVHDRHQSGEPVLHGVSHRLLYIPLARNRLLFAS